MNDDGVDNNGIYGSKNDDDDDGNFTNHSSDGSDKDYEDSNEVLGNGVDGTSPTMSTFGKDGQDFNSGQVEDLPDWLHEIETNNTYDASLLLANPITQVFPCIACKNINNPTTWIPIFLRKTNNTIWELFDKDFRKIGPKLNWNGDEVLKNLWGTYYRCLDAEFIQRVQAVHMQKHPPNLKIMHRGVFAGSLDKKFAGCSEKSTNINNKLDTIATATTSSTTTPCLASRNPAPSNADASGMRDNDLKTFLSMRGADLQAALDKHQDDILCLFQMITTAGQNMIPKKILTKVCKANMTTMTQVNTLIARAGGKEHSTWRLKELGSIAEHTAM
jgi:hypothetical protein